MKATVEVNLEPFPVPELVIITPGKADKLFPQNPDSDDLRYVLPLYSLDEETLERMCYEFCLSVYRYAERDFPASEGPASGGKLPWIGRPPKPINELE